MNGREGLLNSLVTALSLIVPTVSLLYVVRQTRRLQGTVEEFKPLAYSLADMMRYEEDDEGNPRIDARLVKIMDTVGQGLAKSLKMTFLGQLSGQARLSKGLKSAMAKDAVNKSMPILNLAGDLLGFNTSEYVAEHPEAIGQLMQMFAPALKNFQLSGGPSRGNNGVGYAKV